MVAEAAAVPAAVVVAAAEALAPAEADSRRKRDVLPRPQPGQQLGRLLQPPALGPPRSPVQGPLRQRLVLVLQRVLGRQRAPRALGPPPAMSQPARAPRLAR